MIAEIITKGPILMSVGDLREMAKEVARLRVALGSVRAYLLNAKIDLEMGTKKSTTLSTIGGGIKFIDETLGDRK